MQILNVRHRLPWTRFWSPRKTREHGTSGEFFEDLEGILCKQLHPQAATLFGFFPRFSGWLPVVGPGEGC